MFEALFIGEEKPLWTEDNLTAKQYEENEGDDEGEVYLYLRHREHDPTDIATSIINQEPYKFRCLTKYKKYHRYILYLGECNAREYVLRRDDIIYNLNKKINAALTLPEKMRHYSNWIEIADMENF